MSVCGVVNPDDAMVTCDRPPPNTGHPNHTGVVIRDGHPEHQDWPNPDYVRPPDRKPGSKRTKITALAEQVRLDNDPTARLSSADGVSTEAAKVYVQSGARTTRLGQVAQKLLDNVGVWLDNTALATEEIGGFGGTRRMRELRDDFGWNILTRKHPTKPNGWQHCLATVPETLEEAR